MLIAVTTESEGVCWSMPLRVCRIVAWSDGVVQTMRFTGRESERKREAGFCSPGKKRTRIPVIDRWFRDTEPWPVRMASDVDLCAVCILLY